VPILNSGTLNDDTSPFEGLAAFCIAPSTSSLWPEGATDEGTATTKYLGFDMVSVGVEVEGGTGCEDGPRRGSRWRKQSEVSAKELFLEIAHSTSSFYGRHRQSRQVHWSARRYVYPLRCMSSSFELKPLSHTSVAPNMSFHFQFLILLNIVRHISCRLKDRMDSLGQVSDVQQIHRPDIDTAQPVHDLPTSALLPPNYPPTKPRTLLVSS
jgi:hypothetical protein